MRSVNIGLTKQDISRIRKKSAQPIALNKRRIHRPVNNVTQPQHTSFGVARGKGCRGGETAFRNYVCFPSPAVFLTFPKRKKHFSKKNPKDISLQFPQSAP